ncbi:MAG: outer membrane lipoprotein carrier protein LolA [Proteobacteria bacterium]|nr:outer membrane lipoprotein carrier protein LolA [Pseudomonadota bacterium]
MKKIALLILLTLLFSQNVFSQQPQQKISVNSVIEGIQKFYDIAYGIEAIFVQEATIKSVNKAQTSKGKVYFKKPGKMAWIYEEPTKQKIISDGLTLWMYFPENNQVIKNRTNQAFLTDTPQNFLSGLGNIKRDFTVNFVPPIFDTEKNVLLELIPRNPQQSFTKIFATAKPIFYQGQNLYQIIQTTIYDKFGNLNKISFYNISVYDKNQAFAISDNHFEFTPPAGVKIIEPPATLRAQ